MKWRKILTLYFVQLLMVNYSVAQKEEMIFHYLNSDDGLSQNRICCIIRDSRDNMWFGTYDGLNKYNGSQVTIFRNQIDNPKSISCDRIKDIFEDLAKNIWIATEDGLNLYNSEEGSFIRFKNNPSDNSSISGNEVNCIYGDRQGNVWFGTENGRDGLNKWDPSKKTFKRYRLIDPENANLANRVTGIVQDKTGNIWVAGRDNALFRFDPVKSDFIRCKDPVFTCAGVEKRLFVDKDNIIWISTFGDGLFSFDPVTCKFQKFNSRGDGTGTNGDLIYNIIQEDEDNLLIAVDQGGINRYSKKTRRFGYVNYSPNKPGGLNNNGIWYLYKDKEGILWVGTSGGGVNISNPKSEKFKLFKNIPGNPNSLSYDVVGSIFEDSKGLIWIATDGGGISVYDPQKQSFINYSIGKGGTSRIPCNVIRHVVEDKNNDYWIGTWDCGLIKLNAKTGKYDHFTPDSRKPFNLAGRHVWNSIVDHKGTIWLSMTEFGVDLLDPRKGIIKRFRPDPLKPGSLSHRYVNFFYEDSYSEMWLCTNDGLNRYDSVTNSFQIFRNFPSNDTRSFIEDKEGFYWVGTINKGLIRFERSGRILKVYDTSNGLPSNLINGILEDNNHNLWISTGNGISRLSYKSGKIRNYTVGDGLQGKQFFIHSCLKTRSGEMYFGGFNGLNSFHPDSLKENDYEPPVYITEFSIFNQPVPVGIHKSPLNKLMERTEEIKLSWEQSVFSFEFIAINYTHPENNMYAYKMEGFDKDWTYTGANRRLATYTNLSPGTYIFRVKASNNDGLWNEKGTSVKIVITPPYWQTWWFRGTIVLMAIATIYGIFINRLKNIKKRSKEFERLVEERTAQLQVANKELEAFAYSVSHDLRAPLRGIEGFSQILVEEYHDEVGAVAGNYLMRIRSAARRMELLIDNMLSLSHVNRTEMVKSEVNLSRLAKKITESLIESQPDRNVEFIIKENIIVKADIGLMQIVLQNLLQNAWKFTSKKEKALIEFDKVVLNGKRVFFIKDNGAGFDMKYVEKLFGAFQRLHDMTEYQGTGIGLATVQRIIHRHGGKVWAEGEIDRGATFYFTLSQ